MASHLSVSLSESVQASLILQHQEDRRQQQLSMTQSSRRSTRTLDSALTKEESDLSRHIPLYQQCLLAMVFAGMEMSTTFTMIYSILFLEFLGVPTSLVSVEGIIAGGISIIFLPITGYLADRGSNLVVRKMKMLFISMAMYTLGYAGLVVCCIMRLHPTIPSHNETFADFTNVTKGNGTMFEYRSLATNHSGTIDNPLYRKYSNAGSIVDNNHFSKFSNQPHVDILENGLRPIHILGILSTAFLDMAFDTGMSLCRAFVLETSPPSLHNKLLIMATMFAAFGGLLFSVIGTIDFPSMMRSAFNVDGTAATILMFSCGILACIIVSFACTIVTGFAIDRKRQSKLRHGIERTPSHGFDSESDLHHYNQQWTSSRREQLMRSDSVPNSTKGIRDEADETEPLASLAAGNRNYKSLSTTFVGETEQRPQKYINSDGLDVQTYQKILSPWEHSPSNVIHEGKVYENMDALKTNDVSEQTDHAKTGDKDDYVRGNHRDDKQFTGSMSDGETNYNSDSEDEESHKDETNTDIEGPSEISNIHAAMRASYSMSLSIFHSSILGDAHARKSGGRLLDRQQSTSSERPSIWKIKRLKYLLLSIFFTIGANMTYSMYSGNTLTIGVYHGDPAALEGTKQREQYTEGIRGSALGNLITYTSCSLVCLMNKNIIDIIGEKAYFVASQTSYMIAATTFITTQLKEVYFAASTVSGLYRGCTFTLGYIMVNKLVKEETSKNGDKDSKNIGQVMALTGFLIPCHYVILSSMVGPLMAAFQSVWVPIVIGAVNSGLALLVFCLFLVAKG